MANELIVRILGDPEHLKKILEKDVPESAKKGSNEVLGYLTESLDKGFGDGALKFIGKWGPQVAIVATGLATIRAGIHAIFEGEQLAALNQQFELLATNAGLSAEALKQGLATSSGGLINEQELITSANKAIVELGQSAKQLPEIMDLARKSSAVFGTSITEQFDRISAAIATGNARALRNVGIVVDQNKAFKEFAQSLGVGVDALSRAGRAQAILDAAITQGKESLNGINLNIKENTNNWLQIKAAISDVGDIITKVVNDIFGPMLGKLTGYLRDAALGFRDIVAAHLGEGSTQAKAKIALLNNEIHGLEKALFRINNTPSLVPTGPITAKLNAEIMEKMNMVKQLQKEIDALGKSGTTDKTKFVDPEKVAADNAKIAAEYNKLNTQLIAEQLKHNQDEDDIQRLHALQIENTIKETNQQEENFRREFYQKGLVSKSQYDQAILLMEEQKNAKIKNLMTEAAHSENEITKTVRSGIVQGLTAAFSGLGKALVTSGNGFKALSDAVIQAIGAIAIQVGTLLVTMGLGFESIGLVMPTWAAAGAGAVIEGLALITLGGALEASASGGSPGGGGGGGGDSTGSIAGSPIGQNTPTDRPQGTQVQVHVYGNVLDNRQTGLALVDAMNEAFHSNGTILASTV